MKRQATVTGNFRQWLPGAFLSAALGLLAFVLVLGTAVAQSGGDVQVNLDVLNNLPEREAQPGERIRLIPPKPKKPANPDPGVAKDDPRLKNTPVPTEVASLPEPGAPWQGGRILSLRFSGVDVDLTERQEVLLDRLADRLRESGQVRLEVLGYASRTDTPESGIRRLALSRALAVRAYLVRKNIEVERLNVKPLGDQATAPPLNRVDISVIGN